MKPFCSKSVMTCTEALAHYKKAISAQEEIFGEQLNDFDIPLDPINQTG